MSKLRWLSILMCLVIVVITGFQVYWLKDNYNRERKTLEVRTDALFNETVRQVQDSLLQHKLFIVMKDSSGETGGLKREMHGPLFRAPLPGQPNSARVINLITQTVLSDSLVKKDKKGVYITLKGNAQHPGRDTTGKFNFVFDSLKPDDIREMVVVKSDGKIPPRMAQGDSLKAEKKFRNTETLNIAKTMDKDSNNKLSEINTIYFNTDEGGTFKIRIDSLFNDSIPAPVLVTAFTKTLKTEKLDLPFTILRDTVRIPQEEDFIRRPMIAGFAGYKLQLGNTFSYLIRQISLPILFSFFLVGITIFSFVLLYRSLFKQYRLGRIKNDLISNITHELKTPIATVGVAIEALRNFGAAQSPEKTREYLDISAAELQRLGLLVDKVLKFSMLENKNSELKKENFCMRELVQEVLSIMRLQFEKHHARVSINTTGENFVIEADRLHITSVIYNLLDNALKYSQDNPVINVQLSSLPNDIIELKISDNGIGISKEYQAKIFDKFFRVPNGNTHNIKGYGLGLSYVREIVTAHMGFISVESEPGKGSSFSVKLPLKEAPVIYFDDKRRIYKKRVKL
ncbi:MAG: HAMP domain-containing sensor histidine kinase [Chitinophagaceae bacterium]